MAVEIPGYYYDAERKKYYKIEKSQTAPSSVAWSADEVKRRRIVDLAKKEEDRRARLLKNHIKRNAALRTNVIAHSLLGHEIGAVSTAAGYVRVYGERGIGAEVWSKGLVEKGVIPFVPSFARSRFANMPCFYVGGDDDKTGMGVAYATLDEETLVGSYISMDENDSVKFLGNPSNRRGQGQGYSFRTEMIRCPQMSSIKYHKPSHNILLTSREPDHSCGLYFFSPQLSSENDERPQWLLGETQDYQRISIRHRLRDEWLVNQSTPAPASSDLLCVIGTNAGILRVRSNETLAWISSQGPPPPSQSSGGMSGKFASRQPQEIFDQDFKQGNHNIILAGGRQSRLWITDLRVPEAEWSSISQPSSIAHLRSVNEHQILVAGLRNSMALYDMRFFGTEYHPNGIKPLLQFQGYRNEAHFHTGWDVSPELGVVAAAHDDGTVKLFSLSSGRILNTKTSVQKVKSEAPIKALMFQTMPREKLPSLFIGEGPSLKKFSFGVHDLGDEA